MVIIPPKILANAKGINKILGDRFCFKDVFIATGNIKARAPTLFIIAEQIAATPLKLAICVILLFDNGDICLEIKSTTPEFLRALLIIRTAATVITAGWLKPEKILLESIIKFELSFPKI